MPRQLALPFDVRPALRRGDFIAAPCNDAALRFVDRWPDWPARAAALHGPAGSGKSHLVEVWCVAAGGRSLPVSELSLDAVAFLPLHVAIEDVDAGAGMTDAAARALMALFERPTGTLLLTGRSEPQHWPAPLGDLKSRFLAVLAFPLWAADDVLLGNIARKLFADRQLEVADVVIQRMLVTLERTPRSVAAFVDRLDRKALAERRAVTQRLVLDLLDERTVS